jgi:cytochrome c-type biogenesis protein CcmH/NrfG
VTLEDRARQLEAQVTNSSSYAAIDRFTDFAIDALNADRGNLVLALLNPLAERHPNNARIWQLLGLAYRKEQDSEAALATMARAAALLPQDIRIANGHATTAFEAGIPSTSLFEKARRLSPGDPELLLSNAAALVAEGYPVTEAEALIEPLVQVRPEWIRGHEALASWRWTSGDSASFARSFAPAVRSRPTDMALRFAWYRILAQSNEWTAAKDVIEEGRKTAGNLPQFDAAEAYIATETGDDDRAQAFFLRASVLNDPGTDVSHIRHCLRTQRIDEAAQITGRMIRGPAAATAWPYMSLIWRLQHDPRAAWLDGSPPYIRSFDLPFCEDELTALATRVRGLHQMRRHPAEQSVRNGTQTDGPLFARLEPEIRQVRTKVLEAVRIFVNDLPPQDTSHPLLFAQRDDLRFAGAWSVRLQAQGFHVCHSHPLGWISSALYVALPNDVGPPPAGWLQLGAPPVDLKLELPSFEMIKPKPGRLVLFPSTMWHGTAPFADGERLTIAFDVAIPRTW